MNRVLLDTQAFLLWVSGSDRLTPRAAEAISDPSTTVLVSAASAGRSPSRQRPDGSSSKGPPDTYVPDRIREHGFDTRFRSGSSTPCVAGALPRHHGDPFDRVLVAQGQLEECRS